MMGKFNDIDLDNWKDYDNIETDSLWLIAKRDSSGAHSSDYHGNFVPQIPKQLLLRYTKAGDLILDPFLGSGTSLIEAQRLNRSGVGVELLPEVAKRAADAINSEKNDTSQTVIEGDSRFVNYTQNGVNSVQFIVFHPPYWDIIKFSDNPADLSNANTIEDFFDMFGAVVDNACAVLDKGRYFAVVIGDKYANSEIVPLGFYCMQQMRKKGYKHKATIVKNFGETKGKANQAGIWRYRALASDFYIFKHEYIFVFKKTK